MTKYTIDAQGKKLGRVASQAASLLRGKGLTSFARNVIPDVEVEILHAAGLILPEQKTRNIRYTRYSGFPGGLKHFSLSEVIARRGVKEALRKVVLGMLPKNRLRARLIRKLKVSNL